MTESELRKLKRTDLLEMLLEQTKEKERLTAELADLKKTYAEESENLKKRHAEELADLQKQLENRELRINRSGDIAHAALEINSVFESAQAAAQMYLDNIRSLSERQETIFAEKEKEVTEKCAAMEQETAVKCDAMTQKAEQEVEAKWNELSGKMEDFYNAHTGLRELLIETGVIQ